MNDELNREGWLRVSGFVDSAKCNEIVSEADSLELEKISTRVDILPFETRVWRAEKVLNSVSKVLDSEFIGFFEEVFNQDFSFSIYNKIVRGTVGSGGEWHRDTRIRPQYKVIIYLTDCPDQNHGCFQYLPRSHTLLNRSRIFTISDLFSRPRYHSLSASLQSASLSLGGASGDAILVNTTGVHRGNPVRIGERHALTLYFATGVRFDD